MYCRPIIPSNQLFMSTLQTASIGYCHYSNVVERPSTDRLNSNYHNISFIDIISNVSVKNESFVVVLMYMHSSNISSVSLALDIG